MKDIRTKRQEVERGVSVERVLSGVLQQEHLKEIIVVGINSDDEVVTAYSFDDRLRIIGLLETMKTTLIDELNYPEF